MSSKTTASIGQPANDTLPSLPKGASGAADIGEVQPLIHARAAGFSGCFDTLVRESAAAIDTKHDAFSVWSNTEPDAHLFGSIVALRYPTAIAPRGASVVLAGRGPRGCEGGFVQVIPTARPCATLQGSLMETGRAIANLTGLPLIQTAKGLRLLLLPTAGNGCAIVAVNVSLLQ